jgi:tetratricopeptide (TPR) repeat protein
MFARIFPRKMVSPIDPRQWEHLSEDQKKELGESALARGEIALLNDDVSTLLSEFDVALALLESDPTIWYRKGSAFLDYGTLEGKEKALLIASRYFKLATGAYPEKPEIWAAWGSTLLHLGIAYSEHHFFLDAKEKLQEAIEKSSSLPHSALSHLYWDYALLWTELAQQSGEAVDIRLAIQAFNSSIHYRPNPPPSFWNDCGNAYLQMGLLINDSRLYLSAIDFLRRAVSLDSRYMDGWASLAEAYSQLYLNTMDERYATAAHDCYERLCLEKPDVSDYFLGWAQLLGEVGRLNADTKKLRLSCEKAQLGHALSPDDPLLLAQWVESLSILGKELSRLDLLIEAEHKILAATDQFPDDPDLWHAYGICLIAFGHYYNDPDYYEYAIEKLQYGLSLDRTHAEIWHALAVSHAEVANLTDDLDMIERSTRFFARALDLKPSCPSLTFDAANSWLLSCDLHDDPKDLEMAVQLYEILLQGQKESLVNHPEWLFQYATALEWVGDYEDNEREFVKALDLYLHVLLIDPETAKIHFRIALCLVRLGEFSSESEYYLRALHYFRFAARQEEEDDSVWLEWGLANIHLAHHTLDMDKMAECYRDAEEKLIRAGQLGNVHAHYNLASLYSILGRFEEAMELIRKAKEAEALPPLDELFEDEWLDNLRNTETFTQFLSGLETKPRHGTAD